MRRNIDDHFAKLPVTHFPRTRHALNVTSRKTTQGHGLLTPFFVAPVYPGDTYSIDMAAAVQMDTSAKVPLDNVYCDIYWFFVPYRIIDKDFSKILGERDDPYDEKTYSVPQVLCELPGPSTGLNYLPFYMNYGLGKIAPVTQGNEVYDAISSYPIRSYWSIVNNYFRDENLDSAVDLEGIWSDPSAQNPDFVAPDTYWMQLFRVNKFHDYYTSALKSAIKGPEVYIPSNGVAPVYGYDTSQLDTMTGHTVQTTEDLILGQDMDGGEPDGPFYVFGIDSSTNISLGADVKQSAGTIAQLTLAMQLYQLYDKRARFGTRYIETIRGQWGIEVPDGLLQRPEYLGGTQVCLSNVPVFDNTSSTLATFAGNSHTVFGGAGFTKSFVEYGILIGLSVTRIKHTYGQGVDPSIWDLTDDLSFYNPVFANIGNMPIKNREIFNDPSSDSNDEVFAYQEAWARLRNIPDTFSGLFANLQKTGSSPDAIVDASAELRKLWTYSDYYASCPSFSAEWLKEGSSNVGRTLTGRLVPTAAGISGEFIGHEFMFNYMVKPTITRILPAHSTPAGLLNRL